MRFGKHKDCGGEFVSICISNDVIEQLECRKCGFIKDVRIIPKWKRELIEKFNKAINGEVTA